MPEHSFTELCAEYEEIIADETTTPFTRQIARKNLSRLNGERYEIDWSQVDREDSSLRHREQREVARKILKKDHNVTQRQTFIAAERTKLELQNASQAPQTSTGEPPVMNKASQQKTQKKRSQMVERLIDAVHDKRDEAIQHAEGALARAKQGSVKAQSQSLFDRAKAITKQAGHNPNAAMQEDSIPF